METTGHKHSLLCHFTSEGRQPCQTKGNPKSQILRLSIAIQELTENKAKPEITTSTVCLLQLPCFLPSLPASSWIYSSTGSQAIPQVDFQKCLCPRYVACARQKTKIISEAQIWRHGHGFGFQHGEFWRSSNGCQKAVTCQSNLSMTTYFRTWVLEADSSHSLTNWLHLLSTLPQQN